MREASSDIRCAPHNQVSRYGAYVPGSALRKQGYVLVVLWAFRPGYDVSSMTTACSTNLFGGHLPLNILRLEESIL